jgi:hypothetical protein
MPRPVPFLLQAESVVLGVALVLLGLFLFIRGTLPRWLPSGFLDQEGNRAELSRPVYRLVGVTSVLVGLAAPLIALSQGGVTLALGFALTAIALLCAIPTAVMAWGEQSRRSLLRKRSTAVWSMLVVIVAVVVNEFIFLGTTRP